MAAGFRRVFIGMIIAFIDIELFNLALLPSLIAWLIIYSGLSIFETKGIIILTEKIICGMLVLLIGTDIYLFFIQADHYGLLQNVILPVLALVGQFIIFHRLLGMAVAYFAARGEQDLIAKYTRHNRIYLIVQGTGILLLILSLTFNLEILLLLSSVLNLIAFIDILIFTYGLSREDYRYMRITKN
ncbi:hypothetical protein SAMN04488134_101223 [Amphibacillus marinus]|uniref:Uncharacterized protein n=1 Tax=Amphibacillus marinus TaxID=872970 RepID=A0A1H8H1A5_9BACI|nr:hypothetical protein [Amphibacillus marinus]SEN49799.1 hypothetical protein SAMN04488134_101223 [Amphibacillus marinus]